jgi:drug/metabolite transporter (DMT)-like permease
MPDSAVTRREYRTGIACGVGAGALWGIVFLAPRTLPTFTPLALSAARFLLYGLLSLVLLWPMRRTVLPKTSARDWLALHALSLAGNLLYYLGVAGAVQRAGIAPVSLIVGLIPATVALVGIREGSTSPQRLVLPLLMAGGGLACIYADAPRSESDADRGVYLLGLLMAFAALACWTVYAVANARYLRAHPRFTSQEWSVLTGVATGFSALVLFAVPAFLLPGMATTEPQDSSAWWKFWAINGAVALGASVIGNSFWNAASRRLPLALTGQMIVFETVFALLYAFFYEARWPHVLELVAALLLMGSVALAARSHR